MDRNLTYITFVVDRSGSMNAIRNDAEGGINSFIGEQVEQPGTALLTLVQFDTDYEFVHSGVPVDQVPEFQLRPRGATALLDAVGRAINETGDRLSRIEEAARPGLVVFVIMTDGLENSSQQFSKADIKRMIEHQQTKYSWHFTFLAANQDAFQEARGMGIAPGGAADVGMDKFVQACAVTARKVSRMRDQAGKNEEVDNDFRLYEREEMK